ncbi:MAG: winged helix DNA-binding domain-containing protein, partial [Thermoplasmata archaeon]|nr:winged helix DNA-binding domain-containing protein [Thermoplasmata archaeon]
ADAWIRSFRDWAPERAEEELFRRYLRAFGPATVADFVAWTRMRHSDARGIWARVEAELAEVAVEGSPAWIVRRDLPELQRAAINEVSVRLLPYFDSFVLGHMERGHLLEAKHHRRVYRDQGWIAPVLLVDGRVAGVWSHARKGSRLSVQVEPFENVAKEVQRRIREEVATLANFLGATEATTRFSTLRASARAL